MTVSLSINISVLIIASLNLLALVVIKFNDLHHLDYAVKDLKKYCVEMDKKLFDLAQRVSELEGRCKRNNST